MGHVHVWSRFVQQDGPWETFDTRCGARLRREVGQPYRELVAVEGDEESMSEVTCLHCLRQVREYALRRAAYYARVAEHTSELYDSEVRRRVRRRRRRDREWCGS